MRGNAQMVAAAVQGWQRSFLTHIERRVTAKIPELASMSSQPAPQSPMGIDATVDPFSCPQASKVTKDTVKEAIAAQLAAVAALSQKDSGALPGGGTGAPAAASSWPQTRCYNCGLGGHKANFCPKIGADFPAVICRCGSGLAVECVPAHADAAAAMCVVCVHKYLCQTATGKRARDAAAAEQQQQPLFMTLCSES